MKDKVWRTPKRNHSNRPSPSSTDNSSSALGSKRQTLSNGIDNSFIKSKTLILWTNAWAIDLLPVESSNDLAREALDDLERCVKCIWASGPPSIRICCMQSSACFRLQGDIMDKPHIQVLPMAVSLRWCLHPPPCALAIAVINRNPLGKKLGLTNNILQGHRARCLPSHWTAIADSARCKVTLTSIWGASNGHTSQNPRISKQSA